MVGHKRSLPQNPIMSDILAAQTDRNDNGSMNAASWLPMGFQPG
jgi:hypothetical protein